MCVYVLQSVGNKNGKLWTTDEEVSPEVLAKVRGRLIPPPHLLLTETVLFLMFSIASFVLSSSHQVQAIKLLVRWLLGMKNNQSKSANSTLRLLSAMLVSEGDLTEQKKIR